MASKLAANERCHLIVGRRARHRRIGGGVEPSKHPVKIEQLAVLEAIEPVLPGEEGAKIRLTEVAMIDLLVIPRVGVQPLFIGLEKRGVRQPVIPDEGDLATGLEQPLALLPKSRAIEPVKRLGDRHQIHRPRGQARGFRTAVQPADVPHLGKQPFGGSPHIVIGLHRPDPRDPGGQQGGQDAGARADVRHLGLWPHGQLPCQKIQHGGGITGSIFHIGLDPGRESLGTVHGRLLS